MSHHITSQYVPLEVRQNYKLWVKIMAIAGWWVLNNFKNISLYAHMTIFGKTLAPYPKIAGEWMFIHGYNSLVGGIPNPLKNMSQLGWWHSQYMESHKSHVPNHQPDNHHIPIVVGLYPINHY